MSDNALFLGGNFRSPISVDRLCRKAVVLAAFPIAFLTLSAPVAEAGAHIVLNRQYDIRGVTWTHFSDDNGEPAARFRIERVSVENQRRGFLRIGVLPIIVVENVRVQVFSDEIEIQALTAFRDEVARVAQRGRVEIRGFSFENVPKAMLLTAPSVNFQDHEWRFPKGTALHLADEEQLLSGARIVLEGERAGELVWQDEFAKHHRRPIFENGGDPNSDPPTNLSQVLSTHKQP